MLNKVNTISLKRTFILLFFQVVFSFIIFQSNVLALGGNADLAEEYRVKGYEHQQRSDFDQALSYYTKAAALGIKNPEIYNDMGILYEKIGLNNRAESSYKESIKIQREFLPAYMNLAYLYLKINRKDLAVQYFKRRFELSGSDDPWAAKAKEQLIKLAPKYKGWADRLEAERLDQILVQQAHQAFYQRVDQSKKLYKRGMGFFEGKHYSDAIKEFDKALSLAPDSKEIKNARKRAIIELSKERLRKRTEDALYQLDSGNSVSARNEIRQILSEIPSEPIIFSE